MKCLICTEKLYFITQGWGHFTKFFAWNFHVYQPYIPMGGTGSQVLTRVATAAGHHHTTRHGLDSGMVQQFCIVPMPNGQVRLCLDLARLNQALI